MKFLFDENWWISASVHITGTFTACENTGHGRGLHSFYYCIDE